jgi:hypothetical protein
MSGEQHRKHRIRKSADCVRELLRARVLRLLQCASYILRCCEIPWRSDQVPIKGRTPVWPKEPASNRESCSASATWSPVNQPCVRSACICFDCLILSDRFFHPTSSLLQIDCLSNQLFYNRSNLLHVLFSCVYIAWRTKRICRSARSGVASRRFHRG